MLVKRLRARLGKGPGAAKSRHAREVQTCALRGAGRARPSSTDPLSSLPEALATLDREAVPRDRRSGASAAGEA
jgi:hypothetical protein